MNLVRICVWALPFAAAIAAAPAIAQQKVVRYQCEGDQSFEVIFEKNKDNIDRAWIQFPNQPRSAKLRPLDASEGITKYGNDRLVLRMADNAAALEMNYEPFLNSCTMQ